MENKTDSLDKRRLSREKITLSPPVSTETTTNQANNNSKSPPKTFLVKPDAYPNQFKMQNLTPTSKRNIPIGPGPKISTNKPKGPIDSMSSIKEDDKKTTSTTNSKNISKNFN